VPLALGLIVMFFALRGFNAYGNPQLWTHQATPGQTAMTFFDVQKYPPSLMFVYVAHALALAAHAAAGQNTDGMFNTIDDLFLNPQAFQGTGFSILVTYVAWIVMVLLVYPRCSSRLRTEPSRGLCDTSD
jgi:uncharacterized membrane protein